MHIVIHNCETLHDNNLANRNLASSSLCQAPDRAVSHDTMHKLGVHIYGLQETRTKAGKRLLPIYAYWSSGSDHGNHGCEIWIARFALRLTTGETLQNIVIDHTKVCKMADGPRFLFLSFLVEASVFYGFDCRVLHQTHPKADRIKFWNNISTLLKKHTTNWSNLILLGDFNLALDSISHSIGDRWLSKSGKVETHVHDLLLTRDLGVPPPFLIIVMGFPVIPILITLELCI